MDALGGARHDTEEDRAAIVIAKTDKGWVIVGAKGHKAGPYPDASAAWVAFERDGATESCSDGGCGAGKKS